MKSEIAKMATDLHEKDVSLLITHLPMIQMHITGAIVLSHICNTYTMSTDAPHYSATSADVCTFLLILA